MSKVLKPDYGIDAPELMRFFFLGGLAATTFSLILYFTWAVHSTGPVIAIGILAIIAAYLLGMGCLMLHGSKIGKIIERETILDQISWHGNEKVLDVGCGRGLMMVAAARRLTSGLAVGVDIWSSKDQSGNNPTAALQNARIERVEDRVKVCDGDARDLPFPDQNFDVVVSHWVVHNIESENDRLRAITEMVRVLRPNGYLILADIEHSESYLTILSNLKMRDIRLDFNRFKDTILRIVSFGSFRPKTIFARKSI